MKNKSNKQSRKYKIEVQQEKKISIQKTNSISQMKQYQQEDINVEEKEDD